MNKLLSVGLIAGACALAGCIALAGCSGQGSGSATGTANANPLASLATFTVADLKNADSDALAHGDKVASMCYEALAVWIPTVVPTGTNATVSGAFGAFQKARDLRNQAAGLVSAGIPQPLLIGCGPLVMQVQMDLGTFVAFVAGLRG